MFMQKGYQCRWAPPRQICCLFSRTCAAE